MARQPLKFLKQMNFFTKITKSIKLNKYLFAILLLAFVLRFYKLSSYPPSLYWEEAALGYDAYSLLKTGRDHRGNSWPIVYLESFMDYKPPLYVYTAIPSIAIFGLNEFAIRFPSALFGTLTVLVIYFLIRELFKEKKELEIGLIASFLLAISPWHLQFSRAAFESNLGLFLVTTGALFFLKAIKPPRLSNLFLPFSAIFFSLSLYAYHGTRVFTPLLVLTLGLLFIKKLWQMKLMVVFSLFLGLILSLPLINSFKSKEVQQRFQETSVFASLNPILESNQKIKEDGGTLLAKLIHHRYWEYGRIFLGQYFKHFNGNYLFLSGDENRRHSIQEFGSFYHWEIITLILGIIVILKNIKKKSYLFILIWMLLSPIPAAFTKAAPHAIRSLAGLPAFVIISSLGLVQLIPRINAGSSFGRKVLNKKRLVLGVCCLVLSAECALYLHFYYHHYPKFYSQDWQYGYKEAINFIKENETEYESFYLTDSHGRAYMYYLFFSQMDPKEAQQLVEPYKAVPDIPYLGKVSFNKESGELRPLMVGSAGEISSGRLVKAINFLDGTVAFEIRKQ